MHWRLVLRRHPSAFLLGTQLLSLVLFPLFDGRPNGRTVFGAFGIAVLMLAVLAIRRSPLPNWPAWVLAFPALVCSLLAVAFDSSTLLRAALPFESALYLYAATSLIAYMMADQRVTSDELFAAGATFTLLAWGFAYAYLLCQELYPGSFAGLIEPERPRRWIELLFLSFTTLSAVGLGDVLPISSPARVLVMLEQFAGVGYVAVVVSRLIGLTILRYRNST